MLNLSEIFKKYESHYHRFDEIENPKTKRSDLQAFLIIDSIFDDDKKIISGVDTYSIYLNVEIEELAKRATEEQIIDLIRCGVSYEEKYDSLTIMV
jgi:hypothetical protein